MGPRRNVIANRAVKTAFLGGAIERAIGTLGRRPSTAKERVDGGDPNALESAIFANTSGFESFDCRNLPNLCGEVHS